jgi:hypothetical protein
MATAAYDWYSASRMEGLARRKAREAVYRKLRRGELNLQDVMSEPPPELLTTVLFDLVKLTMRRRRNPNAVIKAMGEYALEDKINLMLPLGEADEHARDWVATYDPWNTNRHDEEY